MPELTIQLTAAEFDRVLGAAHRARSSPATFAHDAVVEKATRPPREQRSRGVYGGYMSGDRDISELRPPPASVSRPMTPPRRGLGSMIRFGQRRRG